MAPKAIGAPLLLQLTPGVVRVSPESLKSWNSLAGRSLQAVVCAPIRIVVIFVLGALLESGSKRMMERIAQKTVHRLPLVRAIYKATDKFINLVPSGDSDQLKGMQVVFCQFGQGKDSTGTLALMPTPEMFKIGERDYRIVVIPTAPIPIGGAMLFMPAESVFPTTMSIDAFIGSYVSLGVVTARFDISTALENSRN